MGSKLYVYQIQGILEQPETRKVGGLRVILCTPDIFEIVDVPSDIFDKEMVAYLRYRSLVSEHMDVSKLPHSVVNKLRKVLGNWLDKWVLENL